MITLDEYLASKKVRNSAKKWINSILKWRWNTLYPDFGRNCKMSQKELANNLNIFCKIEKNAEDVELSTLIF